MSNYRLLKPMPGASAGMIFAPLDGDLINTIYREVSGRFRADYPKEYIENNPEWFEKVSDRIEVDAGIFNGFYPKRTWPKGMYYFGTSEFITPEKFPAIKQAIEAVLNDEDRIPYSDNDRVEKLLAIADLLSRCWFFGGMKVETANERVIYGLLGDLKLFPTTEESISVRNKWNKYFEAYPWPTEHPPSNKKFTQQDIDKAREDAFNAGRAGATFTAYEAKIFSQNCLYKTFQDYLNSIES